MKFKEGDKVRFVRNNYITDNDCRRIRNNLIGKVFTIDHNYRSFKNAYIMQEDDRFIFWRSELALVEENEKISIIIDLRDRARAHKAVDKAIAEYRKKYFDWTDEELKQARKLFKELADVVLMLRELCEAFDISDLEIEQRIKSKIDRYMGESITLEKSSKTKSAEK